MGNTQEAICLQGSKIKQEIVLHGFIRETATIPDAIIKLCLSFYFITPSNLFVTTIQPNSLKIESIDIKNRKVIDFKTKGIATKYSLKLACHVPDISLKIKTNKSNSYKHLDGLVGLSSTVKLSQLRWNPAVSRQTLPTNNYPTVITFDSNMDCDVFHGRKEIDIKSHKKQNNSYNTRPTRGNSKLIYPDFIYHPSAKSVIYTSQAGIYKMPLNGIDISDAEDPKFKVKLIKGAKDYDVINNSINDIWLGQIYDNHYSKCAVMIDDNDYPFYRCGTGLVGVVHKKLLKCRILDINQRKWIKGKSVEFQKYALQMRPKFGICRENYHQTNVVYVVSNLGHVLSYDINKNEWTKMYEQMSEDDLWYDENKTKHLRNGGKPLVWMNDNPSILNVENKPYFGIFDLRQSNGWIDKSKEWDLSFDNNCTFFM